LFVPKTSRLVGSIRTLITTWPNPERLKSLLNLWHSWFCVDRYQPWCRIRHRNWCYWCHQGLVPSKTQKRIIPQLKMGLLHYRTLLMMSVHPIQSKKNWRNIMTQQINFKDNNISSNTKGLHITQWEHVLTGVLNSFSSLI
jgi:hypothetical protein